MTIPPLSDEQRQQARYAATEARRRTLAAVKQGLRTGELSLAEVLATAETDDVIAHAKVVDILKALPRVGAVRAGTGDGAARHRPQSPAPWPRVGHQVAALAAEFGARAT